MYNVKVLKYPSGWQYRFYTRPVGFCANSDDVSAELPTMVYDEEKDVYYNPRDVWINPFSGEVETEPLTEFEDEQKKRERSLKVSMNRSINRVYHLARSNVWDWFVTLTFSPDKVNSFDYDACVKALSNWLIVMRRSCPDLKYIIVPEQHKSGRFHFHGLLANCENVSFVSSGVYQGGHEVFNIGKYRLGFSTATKVLDNERVTKYLSKYITKELCAVAFGKKRYWCCRNLDECEVEEVLLESADYMKMYDYVMQKANHATIIDGFEITTTYFEMGVDYDL